ncbi:hypothetical protein GRF29_103g279961 [Pseudopithomyces chartarum]|uniref:RING-type domain-containing protein n=1 Tax=Pseudopithomyces chartarum TaxID=1892770 RepID=A0AAN6LW84_9PLEO|nr:hypothetical protein GRF29_103g279961 [Pseudopithomyces chartarum]
MEVRTLDPVSAKLAIQLQLDDVCDILRESEVGSDEYAAFEAMQISFQEIAQVLEGQCIALSMLRREHDARLEFEKLVQEERQAVDDHNEALRLDGLESTALGTSPGDLGNPIDTSTGAEEKSDSIFQKGYLDTEELIGPLQNYPSIFDSDNNGYGNPSWVTGRVSAAPFIPRAGPSKGKGKAKADAIGDRSSHGVCSACMEQHPRFDLLELACKRKDETTSHAYCRTCLNDLFESSLTDTTLFPPRCCRVSIRLSACMHLLPAKLIQRCEEKEVELATANPVCRCGAEFCYLCAKRWKTCGCDQWHEDRLLSNAPPADDRPRQIAMPEEEEMFEENPVNDVFNDMSMRLAAVADGFAINYQDEGSHSEDGGGAAMIVEDLNRKSPDEVRQMLKIF